MSEEEFDPEAFGEFIRRFLENQDDLSPEQLAQAAGLSQDPKALAEFVNQLKAAISNSGQEVEGGVNWKLALQHARTTAAEGAVAIKDEWRSRLADSVQIGDLWLNEVTTLSPLTSTPKLLSRELWVADSLPLFQVLSAPVAERMANALTESMQANLPEELSAMAAGASGMLRSAGGTMFAMQLGQTLGKLSSEVISGGDLGLPFFADQRAAFVPQNLFEYLREIQVPQDQALIYLAVRELAHARLFKNSKWLRDAVVNQIATYARGISLDAEKISDLAENFDPDNQERLREALGNGELLSERTDEQNRALAALEDTLALIEGWVEVVTDHATKRLPANGALGELIRRRRATESPAKSTFATLVGLDLNPKRVREATRMWQAITDSVGQERRDTLWNHPDLLPTSEDIDNPLAVITKLGSSVGEDAMDAALRDLLGE